MKKIKKPPDKVLSSNECFPQRSRPLPGYSIKKETPDIVTLLAKNNSSSTTNTQEYYISCSTGQTNSICVPDQNNNWPMKHFRMCGNSNPSQQITSRFTNNNSNSDSQTTVKSAESTSNKLMPSSHTKKTNKNCGWTNGEDYSQSNKLCSKLNKNINIINYKLFLVRKTASVRKLGTRIASTQ